MAPSTSSLIMMALGQSMACVLSERRAFCHDDFAKYHPAGSLGRRLAGVETIMRRGEDLRIARSDETVREVFAKSRHQGRRTGAILLLDEAGRLNGFFTDSDLARLFENRNDSALDRPIADVMTRTPITISRNAKMSEALEIFRHRKISELPVVDEEGRPVGLLDITDAIGVDPTVAENSPLRLAKSA
jgi:arabinose-5-phosphate isomerase